jgi:pimeloyl-[acyl-carrier protein] methyl ester esterase
LLTLASNPCFVAHEQWPSAMPGETFDAFLAGCQADPRTTLKRFALLCAQGAQDPRGLSRAARRRAKYRAAALMAGWNCLRKWILAMRCKHFAARNCICSPGRTVWCRRKRRGRCLRLLPDIEIGLIEQASHAFLLEDPHGLAGAIQAFLHECGDD